MPFLLPLSAFSSLLPGCLLVISHLLLVLLPTSSANTECVWAIGQLKCDSHPERLVNTVVEIWDEDGSHRGPLGMVDADDLAGRTILTEKDEGIFKVEGCADDHDWLGPLHRNRPEWYLIIVHNCTGFSQRSLIRPPNRRVYVPKTFDYYMDHPIDLERL